MRVCVLVACWQRVDDGGGVARVVGWPLFSHGHTVQGADCQPFIC